MTLVGQPIEIRYSNNLRDTSGNPAHAATYIRRRIVVLDLDLRRNRREHARILSHELFHFVWVHLGNRKRLAWESLLQAERRSRERGEAGWSAEWRKRKLTASDLKIRTRRWREYCCESFCDTGACLKTGTRTEVTLSRRCLAIRRAWFAEQLRDSLPV
jgi:hypothetical protein